MDRRWFIAFSLSWIFFMSSFAYIRFLDPLDLFPRTTEEGRTASVRTADLAIWLTVARRLLGSADAGGFRQGPSEPALGDPSCERLVKDAWNRVDAAEAFPNADVRNFNRTFRMLNDGFPSNVESTLCHFVKSMELKPDFTWLPVHAERRFRGKHVTLDASEATEAWAKEWGYEIKAVVTVEHAPSLVIYWTGQGETSKGFMIEGIRGISDDSQRHASYIQWDRMGADQFVKYFGAEFESSYLESAGIPLDPSHRPDRAVYGETTYNRYTGAVFTFSVMMEPQRGPLASSGQFGCYRLYARGTKGDAMLIAKTADLIAASGHARNTTFKDAAEMDASWVKDSPLTQPGAGRLTYAQFASLVTPAMEEAPITKSCNDLLTAGISGGPFSGPDSEVSFDARPEDVFGGQP